jgi:hypothetical protein
MPIIAHLRTAVEDLLTACLDSYWADCAHLLDQAATILPAGLRITVIGDRALRVGRREHRRLGA